MTTHYNLPPTTSLHILAFGDVVGRIGREALIRVLPELKAEYHPDLTIANVENIAHGRGITRATLQPVLDAGVDVATSGDHTFDKDEVRLLLQDAAIPLIRPANYPPGTEGVGARIFQAGDFRVLVVNLCGRVFMPEGFDSPFRALDELLRDHDDASVNAIVVDFHAEATSEKGAMGWHADGRVSAVLGTHTHIPTADARLLLKGTAFLSDIGMCGAYDSVLGVKREDSLRRMLYATKVALDIPDEGTAVVNGVAIEVDPTTRRATSVQGFRRIVEANA